MFLSDHLLFSGAIAPSGSIFLTIWLGFSVQWWVLQKYVKQSWIWLMLSFLAGVLCAVTHMLLVPDPLDGLAASIAIVLPYWIFELLTSIILAGCFALGLSYFELKTARNSIKKN